MLLFTHKSYTYTQCGCILLVANAEWKWLGWDARAAWHVQLAEFKVRTEQQPLVIEAGFEGLQANCLAYFVLHDPFFNPFFF